MGSKEIIVKFQLQENGLFCADYGEIPQLIL